MTGFLMVVRAALASGVLEVDADRPLLIYVDGRLASPTGLRSARSAPLEAGTHRLRLAAVGGRTLAEAEVDVPDGQTTRVAWRAGAFALEPLGSPSEGQVEDPVALGEPLDAPLAIPAAPPAAPMAAPEPVAVVLGEGGSVALDVAGQRVVVEARDGGVHVRGDAGAGVWFGPDGPHLSATLAVRARGAPVVVTVDGVLEAVLDPRMGGTEIDLPPGTHLVELLDPDDGSVRDRGLVDLEPGEIFSLETGSGTAPPRWRPL
jgi:hypothetical protein